MGRHNNGAPAPQAPVASHEAHQLQHGPTRCLQWVDHERGKQRVHQLYIPAEADSPIAAIRLKQEMAGTPHVSLDVISRKDAVSATDALVAHADISGNRVALDEETKAQLTAIGIEPHTYYHALVSGKFAGDRVIDGTMHHDGQRREKWELARGILSDDMRAAIDDLGAKARADYKFQPPPRDPHA